MKVGKGNGDIETLSESRGSGCGELTRRGLTWCVLVVLLAAVTYLPSLGNGFTNWDDPAYILNNHLVQELSWDNLAAMFSEVYWAAYAPLTLLSYAMEYSLVGASAWLYHLDNLLLHLACTALVYALALRLDRRLEVAVTAALLFGVHPLHVESVAWISERKDVLYAFFFLSSLLAYTSYLRDRARRWYVVSLLLFVCSLLSKGVAVSLSLAVVAVDYLQGRRLLSRQLIVEKIPFFVLSLIFGTIAVYAQRVPGALESSIGAVRFSFSERLLLACYGFSQYLCKLLVPVHLSAFYPYPAKTASGLPPVMWLSLLGPLVVLGMILVCLKRRPEVAFSGLFFVCTLLFVLQVLPYSNFVMADRYVYLPSFGYCLLLGIVLAKGLTAGRWRRRVSFVVCGTYVALLAALTFGRCQVWRDSLTLWDDVLAKYPTVLEAWDNRGSAKAAIGDLEGAVADHTRALELEPGFVNAYFNRGNARMRLGDYRGALADYSAVVLLRPSDARARLNREVARRYLEQDSSSTTGQDQHTDSDGESWRERLNQAIIRYDAGDQRGAVDELDRVIASGAASPHAYVIRGIARYALGEVGGAAADLDQAIRLDPSLAEPYAYRAAIKIFVGDNLGAIVDCDRALAIDRQQVEAWINRGTALYNLARFPEAVSDLSQAIVLDPANPKALFNRGSALLRSGEIEAGCSDLSKARALGSPAAEAALEQRCRPPS